MGTKDVRKLIRELRRQGWRVREDRKHYVAYPPDPNVPPVVFPRTPSDHRWFENTLRYLRRGGFQWPPKGKKGKR